jgi:hypothetical protein
MTTFYCLIFEILNLEGQVPVFISPRHWVPFSSPPTTRRATVEVFELASTRGSTGWLSLSLTLRPTVSRPVSWFKAPIRGLRPDFYFRTEYGIRLTVTVLIPWGALSDERTGLSFVCAAGPCQRSLSRVLVPWDLQPNFTLSDLRLLISSAPTTRRATVEVFDPASTRVRLIALAVTVITSLHGPHRKHRSCICVRIRCRGNVFTEPFPRNGLHNTVY